MEPGTKLFPSVFLKASSKDALQVGCPWDRPELTTLPQFELGRTQTTLPLSAAVMVNSGKHIVPQFPQRLKVLYSRHFVIKLTSCKYCSTI